MSERKPVFLINGFVGLLIILALIGVSAFLFVMKNIIIGGLLFIIALLLSSGIIMVQPNQAAVLMFFGRYVGSVRESGLWMTVPLSTRKNISLRVRNFNSSKLKVNDLDGNPIEIAAVIVFRVIDSAKALLDVDDYQTYVEIQSETSIRHIASQYPYDAFDRDVYSLRSHTDEIAERLSENVQERLRVAGVEVLEARLTHLAYSTEIAAAMLQRQQAAAIVAARQQIVEGAVGMVEMAIAQLVKDGIVELDDERKANMINNLLVAIVSDRGAQPVINTSSLY
jgi:regulator of protease activity HflC (stomatin/prohibitin superfamily)